MIDEFQLITALGFPAFMCLWFMYRIEPLVKTNNEILSIVAEHLRKKKN